MGWSGREDSSALPLMERIQGCRREISMWKKQSDTNSQSTIDRLKKQLEEEIAKLYPNHNLLQGLKQKLKEAHREEELYWKQRSREQWLEAGDKNTKYFHNSVRSRKSRNRVQILIDKNGIEQFTEGSKGNVATEYFRELFTSINPENLEELQEGISPRVTATMNDQLTAPVTETEVKRAAFSIKGSRCPGADGFTGSFYQQFWDIVGPDVVRETQEFFRTAIFPEDWNYTQLCLIPKVTNPTKMTDMRPISLCSVHYKIVSKVLCSRLKQFLPNIISETQGAFVSGRLISDNILIAHEMVHALQTKDAMASEYMAIKTDMSKAYDRVEWGFLEKLMERMGFNESWIKWIMHCVSSVTYTVIINEESHGFIKPQRGLRQGDPLSPFLFILCAEALVNLLNKAACQKRLTGVRASVSGPRVHHLLFADDSLLLCKANRDESVELKTCLARYGEVSGQVINYQKSSIIFGAKVEEGVKEEVKSALGIRQEGGEGSYLGLP